MSGVPPLLLEAFSHDPSSPIAAQSASAASGDRRCFRILYTNDEVEVHKWIVLNIAGGKGYVGFDAEWRPTFKKGDKPQLGTLQFATVDAALVVQVNAYRFAPRGHPAVGCLQLLILTNPSIVLLGMSVQEDLSKAIEYLQTRQAYVQTPGTTAGTLELKTYGQARGINVPGGLLAITLLLGGGGSGGGSGGEDDAAADTGSGAAASASAGPRAEVVKWKSNKLQMSNWCKWPLEGKCIRYAACDAWAAAFCYSKLVTMPIVAPPLPLAPAAQSSKGGAGR